MQRTRQLGAAGPAVSAVGLGCMGMSGTYGAADREQSIATIHAALDGGVTLLDRPGRELARLRREPGRGEDGMRVLAAAAAN
jgi:hypothetical protein